MFALYVLGLPGTRSEWLINQLSQEIRETQKYPRFFFPSTYNTEHVQNNQAIDKTKHGRYYNAKKQHYDNEQEKQESPRPFPRSKASTGRKSYFTITNR